MDTIIDLRDDDSRPKFMLLEKLPDLRDYRNAVPTVPDYRNEFQRLIDQRKIRMLSFQEGIGDENWKRFCSGKPSYLELCYPPETRVIERGGVMIFANFLGLRYVIRGYYDSNGMRVGFPYDSETQEVFVDIALEYVDGIGFCLNDPKIAVGDRKKANRYFDPIRMKIEAEEEFDGYLCNTFAEALFMAVRTIEKMSGGALKEAEAEFVTW